MGNWQVGRRADPLQDAAAVLAIRQRVGAHVAVRADANQRWSLEQAVAFCQAVAPCGLEVGRGTTAMYIFGHYRKSQTQLKGADRIASGFMPCKTLSKRAKTQLYIQAASLRAELCILLSQAAPIPCHVLVYMALELCHDP